MYTKQVIGLVIVVGCLLLSGCSSTKMMRSVKQTLVSDSPKSQTDLETVTTSPLPDAYTARFEIYTNGVKRVFTASMYHNQSDEVYIENSDPEQIFIKTAGTRWKDFFGTLPFSLSKECLVTGTNQTFCTNQNAKLYFYLNDQETPDVLEKVIKPNDFLRVEYATK